MSETRFYVTIVRNPGTPRQRVGRLAGPYDTKVEAEGRVEEARKLAEQVDAAAFFDSFGVSSWKRPEGTTEWPQGILNHLLAA